MDSLNISPASHNKTISSVQSSSLENNSAQVSANDFKVSDKQDRLEAHLNRLQKRKQRGRIELIMGPMFAGKSTELLRRVRRLEISGKKCLSVKFCADTRYSELCIATHD